MRVVKPSRIREYQDAYPKAAAGLGRWLELMEQNDWSSIQQLRRVFPAADAVTVQSGRTVTVFNLCGNDYRLHAERVTFHIFGEHIVRRSG